MTQKYICQGNMLPEPGIYFMQYSGSDEGACDTGVSTSRSYQT